MAPQSVSVPSFLVGVALLFACAAQPHPNAGTTPNAEKPSRTAQQPARHPKSAATKAPKDEAPSRAGDGELDAVATKDAEPTIAESSPDATSPAPPPSEPGLRPLDVLTGGDTAFLIDYANSDTQERAEATCQAQARNERAAAGKSNPSSGDPSGNATDDPDADEKLRERVQTCLKKERGKFTADVLRFRRDERGQGTFTVYRRSGSALPEVHVARVSYEEVDTHTVKVKIAGNVNGARPICRDQRDLEVKIPNGYSIVLQDPVYGKLTYEAKIGLVAR
jgi:hypothetical protein